MKNHLAFILFMLLSSFTVNAQDNLSNIDIKGGLGGTFHGSGDISTIAAEGEISKKLNTYFSTSFAINAGAYSAFDGNQMYYLQANANGFISPFKNTGIYNLKIGTGLSYMFVNEQMIREEIQNGTLLVRRLQENRTTFGGSIIIENEFKITSQYLISLKVFTQPYINGDIVSGMFLKFGVTL